MAEGTAYVNKWRDLMNFVETLHIAVPPVIPGSVKGTLYLFMNIILCLTSRSASLRCTASNGIMPRP
jgi:hypothetical protein